MTWSWDDVRLYLALMHEGSLTHAATTVGVDVSTLSRRLSGLEHSLGTVLFIRSREGVQPTPAAQELLPDAELAAEAMGRIQQLAAGFEAAPEGTVRLTVPPTLAEGFVIPLLPKLLRLHPLLKLEILSEIAVMDLTRREADLALRIVRPTRGDLVFVKLFDLPYGLYASRALAAKVAQRRTLEGASFVTWSADFSRVGSAQWVQQFASSSRVVMTANSMSAQIAAAQSGLGVAVLPVALGDRAPGLVRVDRLSLKVPGLQKLPSEELWLVGHSALRHVPRVRAVWEFLKSAAKDAGAEIQTTSDEG